MPLPLMPNVSRVTFLWSHAATSRNAANVMHFGTPAGGSATLFANLDAALATTGDNFAAQSSGARVTRVSIIPLDGTSASDDFVPGIDAYWGGGAAGDQPLLQVANVISLKSDLRGRSRNGRVFLPYVDESQYIEGNILGATVAALETAWTNFAEKMSAEGTQWLIASYKLGNAIPVENPIPRPRSATQRRRNLI